MAKKRKTRQEKIILQLKRQLARTSSNITISHPRQEAILKQAKIEPKDTIPEKETDISVLSFDPKLIRRDLIKSLILTLIVISFEFMLYLALR